LQERMVRQLLVVAALVGFAAAAGEYGTVFGGCACRPPLQTYNLTSAAYCPSSSFPKCDISKLVETDCMISCPGPRANVVFRNSTSIWLPTSSITCGTDGILRNSAGAKLFAGTPTLMRPTCGYKASCNECSVSKETTTCPTGYTCKSELLQTTAEDGCDRLTCAAGQLTMYENAVQTSYKASQMYCTTSGLWSNFSVDGGMSGGEVLNKVFTANCILPKTCENCATPTMATTLTQLPTSFHTGYSIAPAIYTKKVGECSTVRCPTGYKLHGFFGTNASVTGLEYTQRGWMECAANSMWTDGQWAYTPQSIVTACLKKEYACGCQYGAQTCSNGNCEPALVARLPLEENSCRLGCPIGYRMIVARGIDGRYSRVHDMTCDGAKWRAAYWLAGYEVSFTPAEAYVTCEPSPFPYDFPWPVVGMDCIYSTCQNERLQYANGAISCTDPALKLVVSHARSTLVNVFAVTNLRWNGAIWSGIDVAGVYRSFDGNVYITCYSGTVPPPVTTTCGCTYGHRVCESDKVCDHFLVTKKPLGDGETCSLGCPEGYRLIVESNKTGEYIRTEDLTCSGTSWRGVLWWAGYDATFTLGEPFITCEKSPFPIDFNWPLIGMSCGSKRCTNERLRYTEDALTCNSGSIVTVSTARDSLVNPFALVSIKWTGTHWTGVDTTTAEVRTFPSSIFITCYNGVVPTPLPATSPTPNPCGAFDEYELDVASIVCENDLNRIECDGKIEIYTASKMESFDQMVFITGKGWLAFGCGGRAKLWKTTDADPIHGIAC
ncbi:hypothetical protein PFISCL1PPCAC_9212, partial [Pristionchus fissidentatus]